MIEPGLQDKFFKDVFDDTGGALAYTRESIADTYFLISENNDEIGEFCESENFKFYMGYFSNDNNGSKYLVGFCHSSTHSNILSNVIDFNSLELDPGIRSLIVEKDVVISIVDDTYTTNSLGVVTIPVTAENQFLTFYYQIDGGDILEVPIKDDNTLDIFFELAGNYNVSIFAVDLSLNQSDTHFITVESTGSSGYERNILIEKFTTDWCDPCVDSSYDFKELLSFDDEDVDKVNMIRVGDPFSSSWGMDHLTDSLSDDIKSFVNSRSQIYGAEYVPAVFSNGFESDSHPNKFQDIQTTGLNFTSYDINVDFNSSNDYIDVTISNLSDSADDATITAVIIEDSYTYTQAPGTNGQTYFAHSLLDVFDNEVELTATSSDSQTITYDLSDITIPTISWNYGTDTRIPSDLSFIIFIQKTDGSKEVLQSAKLSLDDWSGN